jgi:hypothetical protein
MARSKLVIVGGKYFSPGDEDAFFRWLSSLACVRKVVGRLRGLHIFLRRSPNDEELRELIALLYRYQLNMRPLAAFKSKQNAAWFHGNSKAYWHTRVFGRPQRRRSD